MFNKIVFVSFVFCLSVTWGCSKDSTSVAQKTPAADLTALAKSKAGKKSEVVKIVFVGQKDACPCTRTRVDNTWKTLEGVMSNRSDVVVEKIQLDVEEERADKLDNLRSLMVAPGIYFFDENEHLLEMLQGESSAEQISKVL